METSFNYNSFSFKQGYTNVNPFSVDVIETLLEEKKLYKCRGVKDANGNTLLNVFVYEWCLFRRDIETVKFFISQYDLDVNTANEEGITPLHRAVCGMRKTEESFAMAQILLEKGADVNAVDCDGGDTPLHWAIMNMEDDKKIVELFIQHHVKLSTKNIFDQNPLELALLLNKNEMVQALTTEEALSKY